jgi:STE24 endopeptidase
MARKQTAALDIPGLDIPKAKRYSRMRLAVLLATTAWSVLRLAWFASDRRAARLKSAVARTVPDKRLAAPTFIALTAALSWLASLPLSYLGGHVVERRFGLTKQSNRSWFGDQLKGLLLGVLLQTPLLTGAFAVIRRRPRDWWLILAGAIVPLTVLLNNLGPVLLMPLFNKFELLRDDTLRARIQALAARSGVRISDVYEMDMSRQSEKPNAFFTGLGNTKRIVLGDTLLERFATDEVEGVVAHELGHQVHGDMWRMTGLAAGAGFAAAWFLSLAAPRAVRKTKERTGVEDIGDEAALPILALLMTAFGIALMPLLAAFSRAIERRTDRYALELTRDGEAYARAMERLAAQHLDDPDPPALMAFMLHSHPPIIERIQTAREAERRFREEAVTV